MAPNANIILYEAKSPTDANLFAAVNTAKNNTAVSVVSMSFGGSEFSGETGYDSTFTTPANRLAANPKQGVTFVASTGDSGAPGGYPAFSPNVVAVGGTSLYLTTSLSYSSESAWSDGGGGVSTQEPKPSYQQTSSHGSVLANAAGRTTPDVSFDANPSTGVYTYDSYNGGWFQIGGTSLSAPCWAGLIADANQLRVAAGHGTLDGPSQTLPALYSLPGSDFHDITTGNNGFAAGPGYDLATGLGTPVANTLVPDLAAYGVTSSPATISLGSIVNARIMAGGTGTLGATVSNSAAGGSNNLNYTLAAAVPSGSGSATLGTVTPGSDSLAPGGSDVNTVSATSTNLGLNTVTFTTTDPNALNSPQTINATLAVVGNRVVTATPVIFGIVHVGQTPAGSYSTTLSTIGDNNHYTAVTVPGGTDGLVTVQGTSTVFNSDGQSETRAVTAGAFNTAGLINNTVSLATVGEGLAGEQPIPVQVAYSATVFSGSASWTGASGSSWGTNVNWQDTQAAAVQAAPGQFTGYYDSAVLGRAGNYTVNLNGASPQLSDLTFNTPSGSGYTLGPGAGGTLQFSNSAGTATLFVAAGSHTISVLMSFTGNGAINLAAQTQLTISANVSGSPTISNSGTLNVTGGSQTAASVGVDPALGGPDAAVGALNVTNAGTRLATGQVFQNSLTIGAGATLALTAPNWLTATTATGDLSIVGTLAIANWADTNNGPTGRLDIGASGIVINNATPAMADAVGNAIAFGAYDPTTGVLDWKGTVGITSTAAAAHSTQTAIGYTYDNGVITIAAAIPGDLNLDGVVDISDRETLISHYNTAVPEGASSWEYGDVNYDGVVDITDRQILLANYDQTNFPCGVSANGLSSNCA